MFRFSLQPVLDHRLSQEEARQREFSEAITRLEAARDRRRAIDDEIGRRHTQIRQGQRGGLVFASRELIERWIGVQKNQATEVDALIRQLDQEARRRRDALIEAVKARMVLDRLRDRELADHKIAESRAEMKVFDEIAVREYLTQQRREKDADLVERNA